MTDKMKNIIAGTGLIAGAYFISRFLGLIREMVISWRFGAQEITDVYNASFLIPDALNYMLAGGAFSIVLIPMLSKYIDDDVPPRIDKQGQEVFAAVFTPITIIIILFTIVSMFLATWFSALLFPQFTNNAPKFHQLVGLTRLILPAQVFFIVGGLINATLRARGDFRGNAWGPIIYNLGIILGGVALGGVIGVGGLSVGVLLGAILGPFFICYLLAGKTIDYKLSFDFKAADLREFIRLSLPLMIGVSLLTVDQFYLRFFGAKSGIPEGTITCLNYSRTVMLIPIALVGQAAGQVSLTYLSQLWRLGKTGEFSSTLSHTMRGVIFLSFVMTGGIFLLAQPVITLLYYRGAFTPENNIYTAELLRRMIFAVPAFAALQILVNGYYARKNTLRPMVVSSICTALSFLIYEICRRKMGGPGIAMASVFCFWLIFLIMLLDYIRTYGRKEELRIRAFIITTIKASAAVLAGVIIVSLLFRYPGLPLNPEKHIHAALIIGIMGSIYMVIVFALSLLMGGEEAKILKDLFSKVSRRVAKRK
ncbi:MAG: murein biosynthesis integral membrane protein MurJ [Candidatus Aminicenantes bacterium]|nr:murein biosynthesis integral membrane protein MurJ [Candidatus Aminicenantes bacterium]